MAKHTLHIDTLDEDEFCLIAIHTTLEDYRLAFFINQQAGILFYKNPTPISDILSGFSHYFYEDKKNDIYWSLIGNKKKVSLENSSSSYKTTGLFEKEAYAQETHYWLPEFKKVDFFLKINDGNNLTDTHKVCGNIRRIQQISSVYTVVKEQIKSKNNLIF